MKPKRFSLSAKTLLRLLPTAVFLVLIFALMVLNLRGPVRNAIGNVRLSFGSFVELTQEFETTLQQNFHRKNDYVNLNGLVTRYLGIHELNERQKLADGRLTAFGDVKDISFAADSVIALDAFLDRQDIGFVYVLVPGGASVYDAPMAPGYESKAWQNISNMASALSAAEVPFIDMDAWFRENGWHSGDIFFRTDHHWRPQAAMEAVKLTMEALEEQGSAAYDRQLLAPESWTLTTYPQLFLGSHGRRTGTAYAGLDDLPVYTPNFPVDYRYARLSRQSSRWLCTNDVLDRKYTEPLDLFEENPYCIYMYGDNPIHIVTNTQAANDKKLLVLGDSFKLPLEYFLTTQFQTLHVLDLRYYDDGTLAQYIHQYAPDAVVVCGYEGLLDEPALYTFGLEQPVTGDGQTRVLEDLTIGAGEEANAFRVLTAELTPGMTYTLTADSASLTGTQERFVQLSLWDMGKQTVQAKGYVDTALTGPQRWVFRVPESSGPWTVLLHAGMEGRTAGNTVTLEGITLTGGVPK